MNELNGKHYPLIEGTPSIGDIVYVPSIEALEEGSGWDRMKKKGGYSEVTNIQESSDGRHLIFVRDYGAYGMWWETYLKPKQEELAKEYGLVMKAQVLLR